MENCLVLCAGLVSIIKTHLDKIVQSGTNQITAMVSAMRPWQWIKNSFVLTPLLFSGQFSKPDECARAILIFIAFCLVSSAIYVVNDLCDRHEDRLHPTKRLRPIASGAVTAGAGIAIATVLTVIGFTVAAAVNRMALLTVIMYFLVTIMYSLGLKHVAILDVMIIAGGFVLRIIAGSVAIGVSPSHWLVLCTIMLSLFLGFSKRRVELTALVNSGQSTASTRVVLRDYSVAFLDQVIAMVTAATIVCYALYAVDARTREVFGTRAMLLTFPCVMYGLFRYIYIVYHLKQGEDPTCTLYRDVPTILNILIWLLLSLSVVLYGDRMALFSELT